MWVNRIRSEVSSPTAPISTPHDDLAAVLVLRLVGDPHALRPGLLAEAGRRGPMRGLRFLLALGFGQPADDGDLFAVDHHRRVAGEPAVGQSAGEPFGGVACVGLSACCQPPERPDRRP